MPRVARVLVMAAVSVVLPWSTCPIVPTFTWGLVRSNTLLAIYFLQSVLDVVSSRWESDPRPHAYQACALPLSYWSGTLLCRGLHGGQGEIRTPEGEAS